MKLRCKGLLIVCTVALHAVFSLAYSQCDIPRPINSEYIAALKDIAYYDEMGGGGDECYWEIVGLGLPVVEELIDLIDDPILTKHLVPHWGGQYAVGDIALNLLMDIIHIPVVDLLPNVDPNDYNTMGFGVYWKYVKTDPKNRFEVQSVIQKWYEKHKDSLHWKDIQGLQAGGQYQLKPEKDA